MSLANCRSSNATELAQRESRLTMQHAQLDRRDFLEGAGRRTAGLPRAASRRGRRSRAAASAGTSFPRISAHGCTSMPTASVTVFTGKVEVGQNIRTSLAQAVAEELRVPFDSITMVMGDTDLVPWDMGTFGSRTTPTMAPQLRNMAVAGRETAVGDGRTALEHRCLKTDRRSGKSHNARWIEVAHLWRTDARRDTGEECRRRSAVHAGNRMEDRWNAGPQSQRPRLRYRQTPVSVRHRAARR